MEIVTPAHMRSKIAWYKRSYVQVLIATALGIAVGILFPDLATNQWIKALGDGFVKLIRMIIGPIIFCTVVSGISHVQDTGKVGRIGVKALVYFEVVSTVALLIGLLVGNLVHITSGFTQGDASQVADFAAKAAKMNALDMVLHIIPDTFAGAFVSGDVLQVLLLAILFGFALMALGQRGRVLRAAINDTTHAIFGVIAIIVKVAPLGAFGALAYTVGKFGPAALGSLAELILLFFIVVCTFITVVLGLIARAAGFSLYRFLLYIRDEVFLTVAVGASEPAMPLLMEKLERLGCSKSVVGLVVPAGYSFNLDGTNIYMTLATLFISHALGVNLSLGEQMEILVVAMLMSKGASGVSGAGFVTLAATLGVVNPALVPGMAIILGIDQFMSRCRGFTNIIGNGVACVVVSRWENELDTVKLARYLSHRIEPSDVKTAVTT